MTKHTPGPWIIAENGMEITAKHPMRGHQYTIATIHYAFERDAYKANAKLMAAAPDMVATLLGVRTDLLRTDFRSEADRANYMIEYIERVLAQAGL